MNTFATLTKWVRKGDIDKVRNILDGEAVNLNQLDPKTGKGVIHLAIENGEGEVFDLLAEQPGVHLDLPSAQGETPLELAVSLNDSFMVGHLLGMDINARRKNAQGETVIYTALRNQTDPQILKKLFGKLFDINERIEHYGSYLNLTIKQEQTQNFFFLVGKLGLKYTVPDGEDNTSLILAVQRSKGDYVVAILDKLMEDKLLSPIEKQFFINAQNQKGNTALHEACLKDLQTITAKIEGIGERLGLDLTIRNKKGQTVADIKENIEKQKRNGVELEKKRSEERVIRKKEKEEEKIRQREEEERQRVEEKRRRKQEEQRMAVESRVKTQTQKQKILWGGGIILLIALACMYLMFVSAVEKQKLKKGVAFES